MTENQLSDTTNRYVDALDAAQDALYVLDSDHRFEMVNEPLVALTGYERAELLGEPPGVLLHDDDVDEFDQRLEFGLEDATADSDTWFARLVTKHGTDVPVELEYTVLTANGAYDGLVGRVRDVRQQTQHEQKLDILTRVLRHNIRNRVNLVIANATTLQEIDDPSYRTAAENIESVGKEIINLSDKARKAQEYLDIPPDQDCKTDLVSTTEHVVTKFEIKYPNAAVTTTLPAQAMALAPPSYEVALVELMENAVVHHPSGSGPVAVEITSAGDTVSVHVTDECEPIPEGVIETVQRGQENPLQHNDGLGLWIVRWAVDSVSGDLVFEEYENGSGNDVILQFDALADTGPE